MEPVIRKALPRDASAYIACHVACWQAAYRGILPDDYLQKMAREQEQRTEQCAEALRSPNDFAYYCVTEAERMVGRLIFGKSRDKDMPGAGEIAAIYLLEEFWDRGFGRKMMDFALESFKRGGYRAVLLWVLEENDRARRFYEKCGFVFDGSKQEIQIGKPLIEIRYMLTKLDEK